MTEDEANAVEKFKIAYHIDGNDDDELINGYLNAADYFVKDGIGSDEEFFKQDSVQSRLNTAIMSLAGTYYQYRLAITDLQTYPIGLTVDAIIGQLRGLYASWEEDHEQENSSKSI